MTLPQPVRLDPVDSGGAPTPKILAFRATARRDRKLYQNWTAVRYETTNQGSPSGAVQILTKITLLRSRGEGTRFRGLSEPLPTISVPPRVVSPIAVMGVRYPLRSPPIVPGVRLRIFVPLRGKTFSERLTDAHNDSYAGCHPASDSLLWSCRGDATVSASLLSATPTLSGVFG